MVRQYTVSEILDKVTKYLKRRGIPEARIDAEVLLAYVLKIERLEIYLNLDCQVTEKELSAYEKLIERRVGREPVAFIVGYKEFMGLKFFLNRDVLIPRPETEILVEKVIEKLQNIKKSKSYEYERNNSPVIVDLCTGSGNIAISLARNIASCKIYATDISEGAIQVARKNAKFHNVKGKIEFLLGDLFSPLEKLNSNLAVDFIVSNPPYVKSKDLVLLPPEIKKEPLSALEGGNEGLNFYQRIIPEALKYLIDGGYLIMEIGDYQGKAVVNLIRKEKQFYPPQLVKDYAGLDRVVMAQKLRF
ncbi:MAG: peptide chain release factor N(5)-glutamine methyltransferase [bacterium]